MQCTDVAMFHLVVSRTAYTYILKHYIGIRLEVGKRNSAAPFEWFCGIYEALDLSQQQGVEAQCPRVTV